MRTYKSSDLTHKRAEVMKAARDGGAIIQECRSNGEVINEYLLVTDVDLWKAAMTSIQQFRDMDE